MLFRVFKTFSIVVILIVVLLWVGITASPVERFGYFYMLGILLLGTLVLIYHFVSTESTRRQIKLKEESESMSEGGIEEPQILRELTEVEKKELVDKRKKSIKIIKYGYFLVIFYLIFDLFALYLLQFLGPLVFVIFGLQFYLLAIAIKERPLYLDTISPVFRLQGKLNKLEYQVNFNEYEVKGIKFRSSKYFDMGTMYRNLLNGDEVAVEYSPRTKHVWKIYKTEDI